MGPLCATNGDKAHKEEKSRTMATPFSRACPVSVFFPIVVGGSLVWP